MHGEYKMPGGKLIVADVEVVDARLATVQISGDFFLEPDTALGTINRALTGLAADADEPTMSRAIDAKLGADVAMYGISSQAIATAMARALDSRS